MTRRPIVSFHLPLDMGAVGRILAVIAKEYPDAVVGENMTVLASEEPAAPLDFGEQIVQDSALGRRIVEGKK